VAARLWSVESMRLLVMPVFELKEIRYFNKCQIFSISGEDWSIHLF